MRRTFSPFYRPGSKFSYCHRAGIWIYPWLFFCHSPSHPWVSACQVMYSLTQQPGSPVSCALVLSLVAAEVLLSDWRVAGRPYSWIPCEIARGIRRGHVVLLLWETALKFGWTCSQKYPHWSTALAKLGAQEMCFNYHWSQYWKETLLFVTVSWSANCLCLKRKAVFLIAACQPDVPNCLQFFCFLKLRFNESIKHFLFPPSSWLSHFSLP